MQLPPLELPEWMVDMRCIVRHCRAPEAELAQCYLCSAFMCLEHLALIGKPQQGERGQRLGAGHIRCIDIYRCNKRITLLKPLLAD
eukprot:10986249-Karenia_brevis.AAC.1